MGWAGTFFTLSGMLFVAWHKRFGFVLGIIGGVLWCTQARLTNQYDLITVEVMVVLTNAFSWWNWGRANVGPTSSFCKRSIAEQ